MKPVEYSESHQLCCMVLNVVVVSIIGSRARVEGRGGEECHHFSNSGALPFTFMISDKTVKQ